MGYRLEFDLRGKHWGSVAECRGATGLDDTVIQGERTNCVRVKMKGSDIIINHGERRSDSEPVTDNPKEIEVKDKLDAIAYRNEMANIYDDESYWEELLCE